MTRRPASTAWLSTCAARRRTRKAAASASPCAAATRFVGQLEAAFAPLLDHPWLGPAREQLAPGLRVHFHRRYAIYYAVGADEIIIVRVVDGRRDRDALFTED